MPVSISDLWTPAIWVDALREKIATLPSAFNSGIVTRTQQMDEIATGGGTSANIPFFKDITDQLDEIQVENTAPTTDHGQPSGLMNAPILNRVCKNSATALAEAVSGASPVDSILEQIGMRRLKQRNKTLISLLRGAFNSLAAAGAAAPLQSCRLDSFDESGTDATALQTISADLVIDAKAMLGELGGSLLNGAMFIHPNALVSLEKADKDGFKEGTPSGLPFAIRTYRGIPLFSDESLVRAGTTNGFVYETYIIGPGIVGYGDKPQKGDVIDVASLQLDMNKGVNNEIIYDRTRFVMHLNGMKWVGTPAGQSATNAELATAANWNLVFSSANRVGAVLIRTNK